jgi:hypothetical protein
MDLYVTIGFDHLARPDLATDDRFTDMATRAANAEACIAELDITFATKTLDGWRDALAGFSGVWAPALQPIELHDHPQVEMNGYLPHCTTTDGSPYRLPAPPMQFGAPSQPAGPAPELGQHTEAAARVGPIVGGHRRAARVRRSRLKNTQTGNRSTLFGYGVEAVGESNVSCYRRGRDRGSPNHGSTLLSK